MYDSPCAPLLLPWLGEVELEGTSLAIGPRPRLLTTHQSQSQPMYPCSGCLRCSDGCRRRCRKRSSRTDENAPAIPHSPTALRDTRANFMGALVTTHCALSAPVKFAKTTLSGSTNGGVGECGRGRSLETGNGRFSTISHVNDSRNEPGRPRAWWQVAVAL